MNELVGFLTIVVDLQCCIAVATELALTLSHRSYYQLIIAKDTRKLANPPIHRPPVFRQGRYHRPESGYTSFCMPRLINFASNQKSLHRRAVIHTMVSETSRKSIKHRESPVYSERHGRQNLRNGSGRSINIAMRSMGYQQRTGPRKGFLEDPRVMAERRTFAQEATNWDQEILNCAPGLLELPLAVFGSASSLRAASFSILLSSKHKVYFFIE
jgi:hypothetical protein